MKIAFFWTPQFAADILSKLIKYPEIETLLVISQPDKAVWRKQELQATPVKQVALNHSIEVLQPEPLRSSYNFPPSRGTIVPKGEMKLQEYIKSLNLDFIVVVAYGKIIPKSLLEIPKYGCINLHGSILPSYRWASPVQAALRDGLSETGLTTMYMSERMDEWDILQIAKIKVDKVDRSEDIFQKFVDIGPELLRDTLKKIQSWELRWIPQNHSMATYCGKISKEDWEISFQKQTAQEIYNLFRAYSPWPGIYTFYNSKRIMIEDVGQAQGLPLQENVGISLVDIQVGTFLKIWKNRYGVVCADNNILEITQIKLEGKKSMDIASFINGNKDILEYIFY